MGKKEYREHELELVGSVGITAEVKEILRKAKIELKKSRARIVNDLILEKYNLNNKK